MMRWEVNKELNDIVEEATCNVAMSCKGNI